VIVKFGNVCNESDLFNYLENRTTNAKSVLNIKCVLHFSLQLLFENISAPKNILRVMLKIWAETHLSRRVKL
jgi:hypothetical protein